MLLARFWIFPAACYAVGGTEVPSSLGRTRFLQVRDMAIQGRAGVSVRLIIVSVLFTLICAYPSGKPPTEIISKFLITSSDLNPCTFTTSTTQLNVTQVGFDAAATTAGGFLHPQPHVLIRDRTTSRTMPYLQIPDRRGPTNGTAPKRMKFLWLSILYACDTYQRTPGKCWAGLHSLLISWLSVCALPI